MINDQDTKPTQQPIYVGSFEIQDFKTTIVNKVIMIIPMLVDTVVVEDLLLSNSNHHYLRKLHPHKCIDLHICNTE